VKAKAPTVKEMTEKTDGQVLQQLLDRTWANSAIAQFDKRAARLGTTTMRYIATISERAPTAQRKIYPNSEPSKIVNRSILNVTPCDMEPPKGNQRGGKVPT